MREMPKVESGSAATLEELRALDPADPLTPGRLASALVQLDRRKVSAEEAEAIYAEARRIRLAISKLPANDRGPLPPARQRARVTRRVKAKN